MDQDTTIRTRWVVQHTRTRLLRSSNNHDRLQLVALLLENPLCLIERSNDAWLLRVRELAASGDPTGKFADAHQRSCHLATTEIGIGMSGNEQLLIQRKGRGIAKDIQ